MFKIFKRTTATKSHHHYRPCVKVFSTQSAEHKANTCSFQKYEGHSKFNEVSKSNESNTQVLHD